MKTLFATLLTLLFSGRILAQTNAANGTGLLFQNVKTKLTAAEKHDLYNQLGFLLAEDGKRFIADEDAAEFPFDAMVYPTDLNGDGMVDVQQTFMSGLKQPLGMLVLKNWLYVGHTDGVYRYPYAPGHAVRI